jgi:hypothetical protein
MPVDSMETLTPGLLGRQAVKTTRQWIIAVYILSFILGSPLPGFCGDAPPQKGSQLPVLHLDAPATAKDRVYLGITDQKQFELAEVKTELIMLEVIGVYCPQCHKQRPHINRLFHRIQKDTELAAKIKFIGIAAGATPMEVAYLVKETSIPYPVVTDEQFAAHQLLGNPRTPFNLVVTRQGRVLWAHLGIIEDMNVFLATLKKLAAE